MQLLIAHGALVKDLYALQLVAQAGRLKYVQMLIEAGASVDGLPELHEWETEKPDGRKITTLLEHHEHKEKTTLQLAVGTKQWEVVKYLLSVGANPEKKNEDDKTAVDIAKDEGNMEIFTELMKTPLVK
jgi:hypothetical protein